MAERERHLITQSYKTLLNEPDFDNQIITAIQNVFHKQIDSTFADLSSIFTLGTVEKSRIKLVRQIAPALVLACELELQDHLIESFCCNFINGYALPLLLLDSWLDSNKSVDKGLLSIVFNSIYYTQHSMRGLPNHDQILARLNRNYRIETSSLVAEYGSRYTLPPSLSIEPYVAQAEGKFQTFYRSIGRSFASVVGATLDLRGLPISYYLEEMMNMYGLLRQIPDDIVDFEEDLRGGVITLPALYMLKSIDISSLIEQYWNGQIQFSEIEQYAVQTKTYEKCRRLFLSLYDKCRALKQLFQKEYAFIENLFLFYDLRLHYLNRIRNWQTGDSDVCAL
jgi:hypothetical protein